jgi:hypothetical protein
MPIIGQTCVGFDFMRTFMYRQAYKKSLIGGVLPLLPGVRGSQEQEVCKSSF